MDAASLMIEIWKRTVKNLNSWVLFSNGTCVVFMPQGRMKGMDLRAAAVERLKALEIQDVAIAELIGQGMGWCVNCGDDYILSFVPHNGEYSSRYDRIRLCIETQKKDQDTCKVIHVERKT